MSIDKLFRKRNH